MLFEMVSLWVIWQCHAKGLQRQITIGFCRNWNEVDLRLLGLDGYSTSKKWFPYNSGGGFRKWFGNQNYVVNWKNDGQDIRRDKLESLAYRKLPQVTSKPKIHHFISGNQYLVKGYIG